MDREEKYVYAGLESGAIVCTSFYKDFAQLSWSGPDTHEQVAASFSLIAIVMLSCGTPCFPVCHVDGSCCVVASASSADETNRLFKGGFFR